MPDHGLVHIPRALNNASLFYRNPSYIADVFSPVVNVRRESDKYFIYGKEHFNIGPALRADKSRTTEIDYTLSTDTYYCETYGYHELISDRERGNSDEALKPDIDTTEHITECLLLDREYRVANSLLDASNAEWGAFASTHFTNLEGDWSNLSSSNPREDVYHAKKMIFRDSRRHANRIAIPYEVAMTLCQVDALDELRKYTDPGLITNSGLPMRIWGLDVTEAQSSYNSAVEGATEEFEETWGNNVLIAYVNPQPIALKTLTFAVTFQHKPFTVKKWRDEFRESDIIEIDHRYDNKIVAPACGYVYLNAIAEED